MLNKSGICLVKYPTEVPYSGLLATVIQSEYLFFFCKAGPPHVQIVCPVMNEGNKHISALNKLEELIFLSNELMLSKDPLLCLSSASLDSYPITETRQKLPNTEFMPSPPSLSLSLSEWLGNTRPEWKPTKAEKESWILQIFSTSFACWTSMLGKLSGQITS